MTKTRTGLLLAALLALGACSDGTAPDATDDVTLEADLALVAAQATIDDVADFMLTSDMDALGLPGPGGPPSDRPPRDDAFRTHDVTFYDASGAEMDAFDPLLTARIVSELDVEAERDGPRWSLSLERHRSMEISGLEGEETTRSWNGTGTDEVARSRIDDENGERSYAMSGAVTVSDLVVPVPPADAPWPLSGTILREMEVTVVNGPNGDQTFVRSVLVTFDGTQYATLLVDGEEYVVDLADRDGRRPGRRGPRG